MTKKLSHGFTNYCTPYTVETFLSPATQSLSGDIESVCVSMHPSVRLGQWFPPNEMKTVLAIITKFSVAALLQSLAWDCISCMVGDPVTKWQLVLIEMCQPSTVKIIHRTNRNRK